MNTEKVISDLQKVRENAPLVHNITNYVVMNSTANALLSMGASPVMAHALEEVEEMASIAKAVVLNIGTLSEKWIEAMFKAGKKAKEKGIPVLLDPVGAGATTLRTETAKKLIDDVQPDIVRGNASEILALLKADAKTKGVDSSVPSEDAVEIAKELASTKKCVVSISGKTDYITDGKQVIAISNGDAMMSKITGMGCTATALTGAFAGVNRNFMEAAASAMVIMGVAGEMARINANAPGTFQVKFLDALYQISDEDIKSKAKIA